MKKLSNWHRAALIAAVSITGLTAPQIANAATSNYHPDPESRTFANTAGGWTATDENSNGLCVSGSTCPAVTSSYQPTDGAGGAGDGFLRSSLEGLTSLSTTTRITWESPAFTYNGAAGEQPDEVTFNLARRANAEALIQTLENANYSVRLVPTAGGSAVALQGETEITNDMTWTAIPTVNVDPAQLAIGTSYKFRIITELELPAGVIPSATFDYDNVVLSARTSGEPPPPPPETMLCGDAEALVQRGTDAADELFGTTERDFLIGLGGNDILRGRPSSDCLDGGSGDDEVRGSGGPDFAEGGEGSDLVRGAAGRDVLDGGVEDDSIKGGPGQDKVSGREGNDRIGGGPGVDRLKGGGGDDSLKANDRRGETVRCGGGQDRATVDRRDQVARNCERVKVRR